MDAQPPVTRIERDRTRPALRARVAANPARVAMLIVAAIAVALIAAYGLEDWAQRSINGLVSGSYLALGAVGLTLVYSPLKLVNFAHGDFLTFGAYTAWPTSRGACRSSWPGCSRSS